MHIAFCAYCILCILNFVHIAFCASCILCIFHFVRIAFFHISFCSYCSCTIEIYYTAFYIKYENSLYTDRPTDRHCHELLWQLNISLNKDKYLRHARPSYQSQKYQQMSLYYCEVSYSVTYYRLTHYNNVNNNKYTKFNISMILRTMTIWYCCFYSKWTYWDFKYNRVIIAQKQ